MAQRAIVSIRGTLRDDENWPDTDETIQVARDGSDTLTAEDNNIALISSDDCAGDEVRLLANVTATLLGDGRTIKFRADFTLYEGDSCNTTDPEGPAVSITRTVSAGGTIKADVRVPGDGGGDFRGWINLANRNV